MTPSKNFAVGGLIMLLIMALAVIYLVSSSDDSFTGDFDLRLTRGYYLVRESSDAVEIAALLEIGPGIPSKVVSIAWNTNVIAAKRQSLKLRGDFAGDTLQVPVPGQYDFWIIDLGRTNRIGPLSKEEFQIRLATLGQTNLALEEIAVLLKRMPSVLLRRAK